MKPTYNDIFLSDLIKTVVHIYILDHRELIEEDLINKLTVNVFKDIADNLNNNDKKTVETLLKLIFLQEENLDSAIFYTRYIFFKGKENDNKRDIRKNRTKHGNKRDC